MVKGQEIIIILLVVFMITLVSGVSIGNFPQEEDLTIYQECNNCTYCNFTRVLYPNGSILDSKIEADKDDTHFSSLILGTNFTTMGEYTYCYTCGNPLTSKSGCVNFDISYGGEPLTVEKSILYIALLIFLTGIFILVVFSIPRLPTDTIEDGFVVDVNPWKILRPVFWAVAWALLLAIVFVTSNLSFSFLPNSMFGNLFFVIYKIMFMATIIAMPIWFILLLISIFKTREMKNLMERGVEFNTP